MLLLTGMTRTEEENRNRVLNRYIDSHDQKLLPSKISRMTRPAHHSALIIHVS